MALCSLITEALCSQLGSALRQGDSFSLIASLSPSLDRALSGGIGPQVNALGPDRFLTSPSTAHLVTLEVRTLWRSNFVGSSYWLLLSHYNVYSSQNTLIELLRIVDLKYSWYIA